MADHQRKGAVSNAHAGKEFELQAQVAMLSIGIDLERNYAIPVGVANKSKNHRFDLGSSNPKVIVECKSHTWTENGNVPSAKLTVWNEAMYYFHIAPIDYRKIFFVKRHLRRRESLAEYYVRIYGHLIPPDIEILEYDTEVAEIFEVKHRSQA